MDKGAEKRIRTCPCCEATSTGELVHFTGRRVICDMCFDSLTRRSKAWCNICKSEVSLSDYRPVISRCVHCQSAARRAYYQQHQEQERETTRQWRVDNPGKMASWQKQYVQKHKTAILARRRARYAADPERYRARNRASQRKFAARRVLANRRWRAKNQDRVQLHSQRARLKRKVAMLRRTIQQPVRETFKERDA